MPFGSVVDKIKPGKAKAGTVKDVSSGETKRPSVHKASEMLSAPAKIMGPRLLFILSVVLLCAIGLVMVYSASSVLALSSADYGNDPAYFLKRQALLMGIGLVACIACTVIPYRFWANRYVFLAMWLVTVVMLMMTAFGLGVRTLGAERSIVIGGFALQPSEFAKISVLLTIAALVEVQRDLQLSVFKLVILFAVAILLPLFLIYRQPDLGTAIILVVGLMAMAILVGVPWYVICGFIALFVVYVIFVCVTQPYHIDRIVTMFDPWTDPQGKGFQSVQSLYALGSGGLFGTGLGFSRQKYLYLPYAHTDFIYAIIGEELGIVGTVVVALLFAVFVFAGIRISRSAPDIFGMSIVGAMTTMIGFQACVNMMCVIGIAPVTGKALPFISYGGSSIIATLIMVGIILSVSLRSKADVQAEARRDNLFVLTGGQKGKSEQRTRPAAAATDAAGKAAGAGLRVIEGFKNRVSSAASATQEQQRRRSNTAKEESPRSSGSSRSGRADTRSKEGRAGGSRPRYSEQTSSSRRQERLERRERKASSARGSRSGASAAKKGGYASLGSARSERAGSESRRRSSQREPLGSGDSSGNVEYKGRIKYPTRTPRTSSSQRRRNNRPGSRRH